MVNPNPARITDEMWRLWIERPNPTWRLGGIYADKSGYHNTVAANLAKWPNNYSIKLHLDTPASNRDKARAIDLTMSESEMIKWTNRMKKSAEDPQDPRLDPVREFYGTLDGKTVFGLIKDSITSNWRKSSANITHIWHGHVSVFTLFVANWPMLAGLLSVWRGDSLTTWRVGKMPLPKKGETGEDVRLWQHAHNKIRGLYNPPLPPIEVDGEYGPQTQQGFLAHWKANGGTGGHDGSYLSGWNAMHYIMDLARLQKPPSTSPISTDQVREIVNEWLAANVGSNLSVAGSIEGRVTIQK